MSSNWDYALAQGMVQRMKRSQSGAAPTMLEGKIAATAPLTVSLCGGEVMAPPLKLAVLESGNCKWHIDDKAVCCLMGATVVILGRLGDAV